MQKICGTLLFKSSNKAFCFKWTRSVMTYSLVKPGNVSSRRIVPGHIKTPPYYASGYVKPVGYSAPEIKTADQVKKMRHACQLARKVLAALKLEAKANVSTDELDAFAHDLILKNGAYPSPLNYRGYPKSICTSVNNVACHGIPDDRRLENGDIVSIDVTVYLNGYHGDCADTVAIGDVDASGVKLIQIAKGALEQGIRICGPNVPFHLIGTVIDDQVSSVGYSVVPVFAGHGIGQYFHGPPDVYHFCNEEPGVMLPGMTFTIEPIVCEGDPDVEIMSDGWTAVTRSNMRTAQFEHTVLITSSGCEVLTSC